MGDPIWMTKELATAIHSRQLAEHGGADGVRDAGLLDSALARPRQQFAYADPTPNVPALAASYAFGVAKNHAFIDGNKRTAAVVCETFLMLNGYDVDRHRRRAVPGLPLPGRRRLGRADVRRLAGGARGANRLGPAGTPFAMSAGHDQSHRRPPPDRVRPGPRLLWPAWPAAWSGRA